MNDNFVLVIKLVGRCNFVQVKLIINKFVKSIFLMLPNDVEYPYCFGLLKAYLFVFTHLPPFCIVYCHIKYKMWVIIKFLFILNLETGDTQYFCRISSMSINVIIHIIYWCIIARCIKALKHFELALINNKWFNHSNYFIISLLYIFKQVWVFI